MSTLSLLGHPQLAFGRSRQEQGAPSALLTPVISKGGWNGEEL